MTKKLFKSKKLRGWLLLSLGVVLLLYAAQRPVFGYVLFTSSSGKVYAWNLAVLPNEAVQWDLAAGAPPFALESALYCALSWAQATNGALKFERGSGGVQIEWDADGSKTIDPLFLAYATFSADVNGQIVSARVVINARNYNYHRGAPRGVTYTSSKPLVDLDGVLLHEIGHTIGLDHSDKNPAAIVGTIGLNNYPTMNSIIYAGAETLHSDDAAGAQALYPGGQVVIVPPADLVISGSPLTGRAPLNVFFTQTGGDETTVWNLGDGAQATGEQVTHQYAARGNYVVTATHSGRTAILKVQVSGPVKRRLGAKWTSTSQKKSLNGQRVR